MYSVTASRTRPVGTRGRAAGLARFSAAALLAATALVSGCASYDRNHYTVGAIPDDYRTRHPIIVSEAEITEDIVVSPNSTDLSYRDRAVALAFAARFKQSGASELAVLVPAGSANENAARRIARQLAEAIRGRGVPADRILMQTYAAGGHGEAATIRLVFGGITAEVQSACGQWTDDLLDTGENRNYSNFGCATQKNLAAMVANPSDLLGPRGESEIDATRRTTVINDWRTTGSRTLPILF